MSAVLKNMEKSKFVEEKTTSQWGIISDRILAEKEKFATTGVIVADYPTRCGRRYGPYYRLAYRDQGRQKSLYLGVSETLAHKVALLLDQLQAPGRHRRQIRQLRTTIRRALRRHNARLRLELAHNGLPIQV